MVTTTIQLALLLTSCFARCNDTFALDQGSCDPHNTQCLTNAVIQLDMCQEDCSQKKVDEFLEGEDDYDD